MKTMTDDEMLVKIAEAHLGLKWFDPGSGMRPYFQCKGDRSKDRAEAPDYLKDLNACHEAYLTLDEDQREAFMNALWQICGLNTANEVRNTLGALANATARQRSEAFIATIDAP